MPPCGSMHFAVCSLVMADDAEATATAAEARERRDERAEARAPFLFVVFHCDAPLTPGARFGLAGTDEVVVARGPTRSARRTTTLDGRVLTLHVPGTFVSRVHARLVRAGAAWVVTDNESRNGTFVNGERISRAVLADGDVLECGRTLFVFRASQLLPAGIAPDRPDLTANTPLGTLLPGLEASHIRLAAVARSPLPLLLLGDSGAGKEVAARAVHDLSERQGPFVAMNCAAIPHALLESQLFGHVKGAFSGAVRDEAGYFRAAHGGTLFLDELGDLPLPSQAAFLRALEEGAVVPVGTTKPVAVDVRVIAATNRPLHALVAARAFREDLLARVSGFTHRLLPLAERIEDLGTIVAALLPKLAGHDANRVLFTPEAASRLIAHRWPLNVRELRHCLASALVIAGGAPIGVDHVMPALAEGPRSLRGDDDLEGQLVAALTTHRGNVAAVARAFGKAPIQVHRWMKQLGLDVNAFRPEK